MRVESATAGNSPPRWACVNCGRWSGTWAPGISLCCVPVWFYACLRRRSLSHAGLSPGLPGSPVVRLRSSALPRLRPILCCRRHGPVLSATRWCYSGDCVNGCESLARRGRGAVLSAVASTPQLVAGQLRPDPWACSTEMTRRLCAGCGSGATAAGPARHTCASGTCVAAVRCRTGCRLFAAVGGRLELGT